MTTNVRRPIHLQLRPTSIAFGPPATCSAATKTLSPAAGDSLPSQILPNLFVGNQEQTNRETLNRLNISYILSLGLLPLVSTSASPTSPTISASGQQQNKHNQQHHQQHQHQHHHHHRQSYLLNQPPTLPSQNSSRDFKVRLRSSAHEHQHQHSQHSPATTTTSGPATQTTTRPKPLDRDENKGAKVVRTIQCKCINIADNSNQSLSKFFDEAHQFIDEARRKKCNILVHCLAGVSRSPTIAIAYLMKVNSLRLQDAYNLVKQCRPQIDPNLSFMGQLMIYEKSLDESRGQCNERQQQQQQQQQ